jgi:hypothetical protein
LAANIGGGSISILGIDIGISGAVVRLTDDGSQILNVWDMPITPDGAAGRNAINPALLFSILKKTDARIAYVERIASRPTDGHTAAFSFGRSFGTVTACLASAGISVAFLTPPEWKRVIGLEAGREGAKNKSRAEAIRRFPDSAEFFARVKDDGRSDATLIGLAGLLREVRRAA